MNEIPYLIVMSVSSILILFILSKLLGKKQIAQLEFIDYIIGISIGSIAAEMATDLNDKPAYYYIIAMVIFFLIDLLFTFLSRKQPFLKRLLKGRPQVLIYNGEIDYKTLKKSKLDINDLISLCRDKNYFDLNKIAYAMLEINGNISILPKSEYAPVEITNIQCKVESAKLPCYLIIDGRISYSALNEINRDKKWLLNELKIADEKQLNEIILAIYDYQTKKVTATYKN